MFSWTHDELSQGWYLTSLSSLLCISGCLVIYLDDIYSALLPRKLTERFPFHLKENYTFMNGSLAFSAGCLLLTSLYRLLPEARSYLEHSDRNANLVLILAFAGGVLTCVSFNQALHWLTAESVVHCSHDGEHKIESVAYGADDHHSHSHGSADTGSSHVHHHNHYSGHDHGHDHGHHGPESHEHQAPDEHQHQHQDHQDHQDHPDHHDQDHQHGSEEQPLLRRKKSSALAHFIAHGAHEDEVLLGECKGYSSAERCVYERTGELHYCEIPELRKGDDDAASEDFEPARDAHSHHTVDEHHHHPVDEHHHHHVNSPLARLLLIGIQTMFAITLHKLPEGFITYITSETNPDLGYSIFFSLLIHNYTEGFSMCLPLFYAFRNTRFRKLKAVAISAMFGGLSQPLGALLGYLFMNHYGNERLDVDRLNYVFGISMGVTSGFLAVIGLTMYGSAVSFGGQANFVLMWCLVGMGVIGMSSVFIGSS